VYIACSTLCFSRYPLDQALRSISDLHFQKVDLAIHENGAHLKPSEIAADITYHVLMLRATGASFAAFHVDITTADPIVFNQQFRAVSRLARVLTVPVINIPTAPVGSDIEEEIKRLTLLVRLAEAEGVILTVETDREKLTASPDVAVMLCERVPGLGLTLDPSHYEMNPRVNEEYEELFPYIRHVRLRDTSPDKLQVRIGQGRLEYGKIIAMLDREDYQRALAVDIRDKPEPDYPIEPEVRKLKFLLESMV